MAMKPDLARLQPPPAVLPWFHFPHRFSTKWGQTQVLDKLNILGAPFRRVVWLDADTLVRSNVDALCELPPNVSFAAAQNIGFRDRTCWEASRTKAGFRCQGCSHDGVSAEPRCRYEMNSAVVVAHPWNVSAFNSEVVLPVTRGDLGSRDGGDQGVLNSLVYGRQAFGEAWALLPSAYNALARVHQLRPKQWAQWSPAIVHFSRETKPWKFDARQQNHSGRFVSTGHIKGSALREEWVHACGEVAP